MNKFTTPVLLVSFCIAFVKSLITTPSYSEVTVMAVIAALFAYLEYKNSDKQLEKLALTVKTQSQDISELQTKVSSIKFVQQVKPGGLNLR